jgi:hypothetical protein
MIRFALLLPPLLAFIGACSDAPPAPPVAPPSPDTTSHEWTFTMYEVGGMNTTLRDVSALSPDYAIAVGYVEGISEWPRRNAFLWNGHTLDAISLPIYPHDTITIDPHHNSRTWVSWSRLNAIWAFQRDNIWYSADEGAFAHMTVSGNDTSVKQETYLTIGEGIGFATKAIWAKDSNEIYFGGYNSRLAMFRNGLWTAIPVDTEGEDIDQLFGYHDGTLYVRSVHTLLRLIDGRSAIICNRSMPSLSDLVYFGAPSFIWGNEKSDSAWINGLRVGRIRRDGVGKVTVLLESHYTGLHGTSDNDMFFVGYDGLITHYNGASFRHYNDFAGKSIRLLSVRVTGNDVFIVGDRYFGGGVFIHGTRSK